jgi:uncharacterized protein YdaU (DUF1376 family)
MNYYRRFMGDYQRDTSHLSVIEHGAYTLLLDHYYSKRTPLPATLDALYRLCRAMTTLEQEAVRVVVEEFFPVGTDGLRHNPRADKEIAVRQAFCAQQAELSQRGVAARRAKVTAQSIGRSTGQATDRSTEGLTVRSSPSISISISISRVWSPRRLGLSSAAAEGAYSTGLPGEAVPQSAHFRLPRAAARPPEGQGVVEEACPGPQRTDP